MILSSITTINAQLVIDQYTNISTNAYINNISIDSDNYIWICTSNGISKIGNIDAEPQHYLKGVNIKSAFHHRKLGTIVSDGTKLINVESGKEWKMPEQDIQINDFILYKGRFHIATNKGLYLVQPKTEKYEVLNSSNTKLKTDHINFIHLDKKEVLWLGTQKGEVRIEGKKWKVYHSKINVTDHFENKEGLWFIGNGEMWLVDYYNREYNAGLNADLYTGTLNDFAIDSKGRLYVASEKLVRYDPYEEQIIEYNEDAGLLSKKCTTIACDKNDNIWIGTGGTGLYRLVFDDAAIATFNVICLLDKPISCTGKNNASIKVSVTGGQGPYSYEWTDPEMKGKNPKNLAAGEYTVKVKDQILNEMSASITIVDPDPITIDLVDSKRISGPNRRDGMIEIMGSGGTGGLNYKWSNGTRSNVLNRVKHGMYTVTVTDENKCSKETAFEIQKEKFIPELDISKIEVGKTLRINELYFTADSSDITEESYEVLEEIYQFLVQNPTVVIEIGGHTNTIPSHDYCDKLSSARAKTIAQFFYGQGIPNNRLSYKGYGKRQPITTDQSLAGRKRNQRVEIKILAI